jgi:hypothetical protein
MSTGRCNLILIALLAPAIWSQDSTEETRAGLIVKAQAEKAGRLQPYEPSKAENAVDAAEDLFLSGRLRWRPYFESAYAGGGVTLGAGYRRFVSPYNTLDLRGSFTFSGYKRLETEFLAPRLFNRRGVLSVLAGWREATQVAFYGLGTGNTSKDDLARYSFRRPYVGATLQLKPARRLLVLGAGLELTQWDQGPADSDDPSVEEVYTPASLPGLGGSPTYIHSQGTVALDWRTSPGYTRRGGYYGVTLHSFTDTNDLYGFRQVDYDAIQHVPILRENWVLSFRGQVRTTHTDRNQVVPFFMLPALGGGPSLRGYPNWRFRDRNSLLVSAEWRTMVNRFLDTAVFYDAGKVTARRSDLNFARLKSDVGLGFRFHGPTMTPLRIDIARSNEGWAFIIAASAVF